jgi:hypothetical protein
VIVALLLAGLLSGLGLIVVGGTAGDPGTTTTTTTTSPLRDADVSKEAIGQLSGLAFPDGTENFLATRVGEDQFDVTFTMSGSDEPGFIEGSELPAPEVGQRLILHSSPLWELNPAATDDGATTPEIRGTSSSRQGVRRTVELLDEGPDVVRARVVLTAAPPADASDTAGQ